MRLVTTFILLFIYLTATAQDYYSEVKYINPNGKSVIIQNSYPKGGGSIDGMRGYTDTSGKTYGYALFWTKVINETDSEIEINLTFPAESIKISPTVPMAHAKILLPTDELTPEKISQKNYGISSFKAFLDSNFNKPTTLKRKLKPKEEYYFYTTVLSFVVSGMPRAGFVLNDKELFYQFSISADSATVPVGRISFKK